MYSTNVWNARPDIRQEILEDQNPKWWRNYVGTPEGVRNPLKGGGFFVPMLTWPGPDKSPFGFLQPDATTAAKIDEAIANAAGGYISTFTEFDGQGYSAAEAIAGWHRIVTYAPMVAWRAAGGKLISPYTVADGSVPGSDFDLFMTGVAAAGDPLPDEIALDKYAGTTTDNPGNVAVIMGRVDAYHSRYPGKFLWLQEFSIATAFPGPTDTFTLDFQDQATAALLSRASYVRAWLWWYGGPLSGPGNSAANMAMYQNNGTIRPQGAHWRTLDRT